MKKEELYKFMIENGIEINKDNPNNLIAFIPYYLLDEFKDMLGYTFLSERTLRVVVKKDYVCFEMPEIFEYFNVDPNFFLDLGEPKKMEELYSIREHIRTYTPSELLYSLGRGRKNPVLFCSEELYRQLKFMNMVDLDRVKIGDDNCDIVANDLLLPYKDENGIIIGYLIYEDRPCIIYRKEKPEGI